MAKESHLRSILKTFSWRVVATLITMLVAFFFTGNTKVALEIGFLDTLIKLFAYYGHERAWLKLPEKKDPDPEYEI